MGSMGSTTTVMAYNTALNNDYFSDDSFIPLQAMGSYAPNSTVPSCLAFSTSSLWLTQLDKSLGINSELNLNPNLIPAIRPQSTSSFLTCPIGFRHSVTVPPESLAMKPFPLDENRFWDLGNSSTSSNNSNRSLVENGVFSWEPVDCSTSDKEASSSVNLMGAQDQMGDIKWTTDYIQNSSLLMAVANLQNQNLQSPHGEIKSDGHNFITSSSSSFLWPQQNQLC